MAGRGPICAVSGCRNYRIQRDQKSFYRFPKNKELCTQWVMKSNRPDLDEILKKHGPEHLYKSYVVCSDHFQEKDFRNRRLLSQGIWPGAVPSLSLPNAADTTSSHSPKKTKIEDCEAEYTSNVVEDASVSEKHLTETASRRIAKTCCSDIRIKYRNCRKSLSKYKLLVKRLREKDSKNESEANASTPVVADSGMMPSVSTSHASSSSVGSKRKWQESKDDEIQTAAQEPLSLPLNGNDEFDLLGMGIAAKMRKISKINNVQCIIAERLISEVIYHAQLQSLTFDTVIQDSDNRVN